MSSSRSSSSRTARPSGSSRSRSEATATGGSSSSRSKGATDRREIEPFPSNVAIVDNLTALGAPETEPFWPVPEFGNKTDIKNVNEKTCQGTWVAAGTMFPLGMAIPSGTVCKYGMYLPPG